jgi:hypothetical protein
MSGYCTHCAETRNGDGQFCPACGTQLSYGFGPPPAAPPLTTDPLFPKSPSIKSGTWIRAALGIGAAAVVFGVVQSNASKPLDTTGIHDPLTDSVTAPSYPSAGITEDSSPVPVIPAADGSKQNDKGWVLQSFKPQIGDFDQFEGIARITNYNSETSNAVFTFTISQGGGIVATMKGSVSEVASGQTVTVDLYSEDHMNTKTFTYEFQTDISYAS